LRMRARPQLQSTWKELSDDGLGSGRTAQAGAT
jgi:hypothetical protein